MNTKQLRQKILDLAIKGKLVPQDPNDEPASKLLERIRAEKEQLIKDKKIKRDKNESYIFVGDDKLHYEKFADGSVVCIEDEIPFEIPENWAWERLQNLCILLTDGTHQTPTYTDMGHIFLSSKNVTTNKINWDDVMHIPDRLHEKLYSRLAPELNDILLAKNGTIGKAALVDRNIEFDVYVTLAVIRLLKKHISPQYIHKIIESKYVQDFFKGEQKGIGVPNLHLENIRKTLIPIPQKLEQVRISNTVQELLEIIETVENDKIDLSELIKQTKSKVLDLAIRGKLVPQVPNDEPADKLLEKIREEKEKLIKEGKIKRDKNETFIYKNSDDNSYYEQIDGETICIDDDLPFEIPESWSWCRLGNIGDWGAGATPNRNKPEYYNNGMIPWLKTGDLNDGYINTIPEYITEQALKETSVCIKPKGTILIAMYGATIGKLGILNIDSTTNQACCACQCIYINNLYLFYYLMSQRNNFKKMGLGGAQPNISRELLVNYYFALPPINEQLKIVSKIKDIFAQLDTIQEIFNK